MAGFPSEPTRARLAPPRTERLPVQLCPSASDRLRRNARGLSERAVQIAACYMAGGNADPRRHSAHRGEGVRPRGQLNPVSALPVGCSLRTDAPCIPYNDAPVRNWLTRKPMGMRGIGGPPKARTVPSRVPIVKEAGATGWRVTAGLAGPTAAAREFPEVGVSGDAALDDELHPATTTAVSIAVASAAARLPGVPIPIVIPASRGITGPQPRETQGASIWLPRASAPNPPRFTNHPHRPRRTREGTHRVATAADLHCPSEDRSVAILLALARAGDHRSAR